MLSDTVTAYIKLRHATGFKFAKSAGMLKSFAAFAEAQGDAVVRVSTALEWAALATSPQQRHQRLLLMRRFALVVKAEDARHEVPPVDSHGSPLRRRTPHIYTQAKISQILRTAADLPPKGTIRPIMYTTLFGLLAATGLRISEALALKCGDISEDGLIVRKTKFKKSRLLPLHETTWNALAAYMSIREQHKADDDHLFILQSGRVPVHETVRAVFIQLAISVGLRDEQRRRGPCLHDLRHTFAVRSLEQCGRDRDDVARHMVALSTYLGHVHATGTYWYLEATPILLKQIAETAENMHQGVGQ